MKRFFTALVFTFSFLAAFAVKSQKPVALSLNDTEQVILAFPSAVKYVDLGSADIKGRKTSHSNILQLKSDIPFFDETTASVVTADGRYYSFSLSYAERIENLAIDMSTVRDSVTREDCFTPHNLFLSDIKTSHVIFEEKLTDIVVGLDSILADYADNIDNIIKCKAASPDFSHTSLSAVSESGAVYVFNVFYAAKPEKMSIYVEKDTSHNLAAVESDVEQFAMFNDQSVNDTEMIELGKRVTSRVPTINNVGAISQNMIFALTSIYIKDDILMFCFNLENMTHIDYEIEFMKMYIADRRRGKRTAQQEYEITPIFTYSPSGDDMVIEGRTSKTVVYFFKRFTVPVKRLMYVEAFERNGGRHIKFSISNSEILKAKELR